MITVKLLRVRDWSGILETAIVPTVVALLCWYVVAGRRDKSSARQVMVASHTQKETAWLSLLSICPRVPSTTYVYALMIAQVVNSQRTTMQVSLLMQRRMFQFVSHNPLPIPNHRWLVSA
jgi:hypothetical protein